MSQHEHRRECQHQGQGRHGVGLTRMSPERRHERQVVVRIPEPRIRADVQVRQARAREQERRESQQEREDTAALRHGA